MLKIVLIDDEIIVLRGISALLKKQSEYELAGTNCIGDKTGYRYDRYPYAGDERSGYDQKDQEKPAGYGVYRIQRL